MSCKQILSKPLICGVALSVLALAPLTAKADTMMSDSSMSTSMSTTSMDMAPMTATGTVVRYYSDGAGYVSAMDLQTAEGVKFVRFSPGMAQRLATSAPVGGTATVYISGATNPEVIGTGTTPPKMKMMPLASEVENLDSVPYITLGAKPVKVRGTLKGIVTNRDGEVVGLILSSGKSMEMNKSMAMEKMDMSKGMMMAGSTLVRITRDFRSLAPGYAGNERVTPLFKGSDVEVMGYPEAPRYGVLSTFENRIFASAIVVNGQSVGALGIQRLMLNSRERNRGMMNSMGMTRMSSGGTMNAEQMNASGMGYMTYGGAAMSGEMSAEPGMSGETSTSSTTTKTTTTTTTNPGS